VLDPAFIMLNFATKLIQHGPECKRIVCQNQNGPCPLLAICNALILRGQLTLPSGSTEVNSSQLQHELIGFIVDRPRSGQDANLQHQIEETINLVQQGRFVEGIDVNPRFGGPERMEYTAELSIFDLSGVRILHGWIVDERDTSTFQLIGDMSYNEVTLAVVTYLQDGEVVESIKSSLSGSLHHQLTRRYDAGLHSLLCRMLPTCVYASVHERCCAVRMLRVDMSAHLS
jgi:hypothetical protein